MEGNISFAHFFKSEEVFLQQPPIDLPSCIFAKIGSYFPLKTNHYLEKYGCYQLTQTNQDFSLSHMGGERATRQTKAPLGKKKKNRRKEVEIGEEAEDEFTRQMWLSNLSANSLILLLFQEVESNSPPLEHCATQAANGEHRRARE